jgi:hypothetical protein
MYASWVLGEKPRTVMSRIMRVRSSLMSHLRRKVGTEVILDEWSLRRLADEPIEDGGAASFDLPRQRFSSTQSILNHVTR